MVIVLVNGHGDKSSNPGRGWLHGTTILRKEMNLIILTFAMGNSYVDWVL